MTQKMKTMAKRGRPQVEEREKEYCEVNSGDRIIQSLITAGGSQRSMTNAFYSSMAINILMEAASKYPESCTIPFWNEIMMKNCITEQMGRMIAQDHYSGHGIVDVARVAAKAYHEGHTAKEVAAYLKEVRRSGILYE